MPSFSRLGRAALLVLPSCALALLLPYALAWARAALVLLRFEGEPPRVLSQLLERPFSAGACGPDYPGPCTRRAPSTGAPRGGLVLAHGIHEEGEREPRLVHLAEALARAGFVVVTPRLATLAAMRVGPDDAQTIAASARALAAELGQPSVPVFGVSFAGGLALRAACEGAGAIGRVVALGAHHDAARTARFLLGEPARGPAGESAPVTPHPYGRKVIWRALFGVDPPKPFGEPERTRALAAIAGAAVLDDASPAHCPGPVRVPVFLAHGLGDTIIPYTETLWNRAQLPVEAPLHALLSPAIGHAEYSAPDLGDRLELVGFIARALF
jgi:pimeloyl-ACP methyl ester carboxylesterase